MTGIYFKARQLPVQFLLCIAITNLTRMLTIDIKSMTNEFRVKGRWCAARSAVWRFLARPHATEDQLSLRADHSGHKVLHTIGDRALSMPVDWIS